MKKLINKNQKGFTLIEMLIVMVIVGVLVVLVIPTGFRCCPYQKLMNTGCDAFQSSSEADALAQKASTGYFPSSRDFRYSNEGISKACTGQTVCGIDSTTGKVTLTPAN